MALIELNLEKPALKRTESAESSTKQPSLSLGLGKSESSESHESGKSSEASSTVEVPEGEPAEGKSSGGGLLRRIAMLGATVGAVVAVRRWRSRRRGRESEQAEFEEEWETPQSE